jgi:hypothetical protein
MSDGPAPRHTRIPVDKRRRGDDTSRSMFASKPGAGPKRWPRGQKFLITAAGSAALASHGEAVAHARASGRAALDTALAGWAAPLGLKSGDGTVLGELRGGRLGLPDLVGRLESSGITPEEVRGALQRLVEQALVEPVPLASQLGA